MSATAMSSGAVAHWFPGRPGTPTLLVLPALGVVARHYQRFSEAAQAQGFHVLTLDYRGQGASDLVISRGTRFGYADLVAGDLTEAITWARGQGTGPLVLIGHSLGGQLAAALESMSPGEFDGLALVAAGTPHWRAFTGRARLVPLVLPTVFAGIAHAQGVFEGRRFGFGRQSAQLIEDWARMARTGSWSEKPVALPDRSIPLLAISFGSDQLAPTSAVDALVRFFPCATTTRAHFGEPSGHVGWLKQPDVVVDVLNRWVAEILAPEKRG
ncbi:alpha/beta hydrolase family protein [Nocardia rosealba]|uniref:alpha/beta hydrolase family protein n=1 Tax=Nocardia rosealba TaxID=2878563 RepID=UPI001CDA3007|nr:alpha/beta fold hydrolase [Nocardia rosealba]MCA2207600.1 alpha/beta fold hydrolase [Nocardia rosealba]